MNDTRSIDRAEMVLALNALKNIADDLCSATDSRSEQRLHRIGRAMQSHLETLGWGDGCAFVPDEDPLLDLPLGQRP